MSAPLIIRRIDAALTLMDAEGMVVRAIYLSAPDLEAFLIAQEEIERPVRHRGHDVRPITGKKGRSCIYSTRGVARAVPRQV